MVSGEGKLCQSECLQTLEDESEGAVQCLTFVWKYLNPLGVPRSSRILLQSQMFLCCPPGALRERIGDAEREREPREGGAPRRGRSQM